MLWSGLVGKIRLQKNPTMSKQVLEKNSINTEKYSS